MQIAGVVAVYIVAFLLKGVFGYAHTAALVVGTSLIIPPHHAVVLAAISNLINQVQFVPRSLREGDRRVAGRLSLWVLPAIAAGVALFALVDSSRLSMLIGIMIFLLVLAETLGLTRRAEPFLQRENGPALPGAGIISGLMAGFIGAGAVIFLSFYVRAACPEKLRFRSTMLLIGTIFVGWRSLLLVVAGLVSLQIMIEALILTPVAAIAGHLGTKAVPYIPNAMYFRLYQVLLMAAAMLLVARGFGWI